MKIITLYFLIFIPCITFGQLFPVVPEFRGNIKKVIEKRYGQEFNPWRKDSASYKPGVYSGWKYTYLFDKNSALIRRINTFQGKVRTEYTYQTETVGNRKIVREKTTDFDSDRKEYVIEYENFLDQEGYVRKVNFWSGNTPESAKELFLFEVNALYDRAKLIEFTRHNIKIDGDTASGEKCNLFYDSDGRLAQIDRKDISSGFKTAIQYNYNQRGFVDHYSIDLLTQIQEYGREQIQEIYFKYDRRGNWTRMYWKSGKKNRLEAKRKVSYY